MTVEGLRVGEGLVDLRFDRSGSATTRTRVVRRDGPVEVVVRA